MDLIEQLERATEGSRELDWRIECHLQGWSEDHMRHAALVDYTTSLDAALSLVPEGWNNWLIRKTTAVDSVWFSAEHRDDNDDVWRAVAATPALALCIVSLKARCA